jgi:formate-dependent nitrite reductase membrane component NrfD
MPVLLAVLGLLPWTTVEWGVRAPLVALVALALTGGLLVWDLEHPERFWMVLLKPQWRSWLVRGGFIITGYGVLLTAHLVLAFRGRADLTPSLAWVGGPLAILSAVYTAYLLAQAKARDLWQSPLLPAHFLVQAFMAGGAVLLLMVRDPRLLGPVVGFFGLSVVLHLGMVAGEVTMAHPTAHGALAAKNMVRGKYADWFWSGVVLTAAALFVVGSFPGAAGAAALAGLFAYEHAYVQAGQSVPLA